MFLLNKKKLDTQLCRCIGAGAGTGNRSRLALPSLELVRAPGIDPGWLRLRALMDIYGSIFLLICSTSFLRLMDDLFYFREFWVKPLTQN
jgi:hypothetical protein